MAINFGGSPSDEQHFMRTMSNTLSTRDYLDYVRRTDGNLPRKMCDDLTATTYFVTSHSGSVPVIRGKEYNYYASVMQLLHTKHTSVYKEHAIYFLHRVREVANDENLLRKYKFYCTDSPSDRRVVHIRMEDRTCNIESDVLRSPLVSDMTMSGTLDMRTTANIFAGIAPVSIGNEEDTMKVSTVEVGLIVQNKLSRRIGVIHQRIGTTTVALVYGDNTREIIGIDNIRSCHKAFVHGGLYVHRGLQVVFKVQYDGVADELVLTSVGLLSELKGGESNFTPVTNTINSTVKIADYEPLLVVTDDPLSLPLWAIS